MPKDSRIPDNIVNPFSGAFLDTWQLWKDYKWEQHKFKYKGCISEQVALMRLTKLADGSEATAVAIVMQSIGEGWAGFYVLKVININQNGRLEQGKRQLSDDLLKQKLAAKRPTGF